MQTTRELAREQMMSDIVGVGRRHLSHVLPADLSLRAVARDLGVVPSALYRYVRDRDALLTLLIVDAYDEIGAAVETAVAGASRRSPRGQLEAAVLAMRHWAVAEPSRFMLLYGTPVPGYDAPAATTNQPGTRVIVALTTVLENAHRRDMLRPVRSTLPRSVRSDMEALRREYGLTLPPANLARVLGLWSAVVGAVVFDVADQYGADTLTDREAFLRAHVAGLAETVGL